MTELAAIRTRLLEEDSLLSVTLSAPPGNILTIDLMRSMDAALEEHRQREHLKLILIRGAGGQFSYGASIQEHQREHAGELLQGFHHLVRRIVTSPVPVAAAVEGRCLGAGFELALCCHLLFVTPDASLGSPEIRLGVFPPVLAALGRERLGPFRTERLFLTGETIRGRDLLDWGLALPLDPSDPQSSLVEWFRERMAPLSAYSLREATRALRDCSSLVDRVGRPLTKAENRYLERLVPSHDGNEGIRSFLEQRDPVWRNA